MEKEEPLVDKFRCNHCGHIGWTTPRRGCRSCGSRDIQMFREPKSYGIYRELIHDLSKDLARQSLAPKSDAVLSAKEYGRRARQRYPQKIPDDASYRYFLSRLSRLLKRSAKGKQSPQEVLDRLAELLSAARHRAFRPRHLVKILLMGLLPSVIAGAGLIAVVALLPESAIAAGLMLVAAGAIFLVGRLLAFLQKRRRAAREAREAKKTRDASHRERLERDDDFLAQRSHDRAFKRHVESYSCDYLPPIAAHKRAHHMTTVGESMVVLLGVMATVWSVPALVLFSLFWPGDFRRPVSLAVFLISIGLGIFLYRRWRDQLVTPADKITFFTGVLLGPVGVVRILL